MSSVTAKTVPDRPIRWPFRALAGIIVLAGVAAVAGGAYLDWMRGATSDLRVQVAMLPGALWALRLAGHALIEGRSPTAPGWPFASVRVALAYGVIVWLLVRP